MSKATNLKLEGKIFMKKLKKTIALCLSVVMALSVLCIGASAKEVYQLKNGVTLTTYTKDEITPRVSLMRTVDATFNKTIAKYPSSTLIGNSLALGTIESTIEIEFTTRPTGSCYFSLYDMTTDEYLTSGSNNMYGPIYMNDVYKLEGLTGGHKYRIRMAGAGSSCRVAGTITSY